jgi:feruloyl esterase
VDGKPYAIGFHLRLPDNWNERFFFQGGGGTDGSIGDALGGGTVTQGYAVVSTDGGHDNVVDYDSNAGGTAAFGVDPQARIDYGYNAVDKVTQVAKYILKLHYGKRPDYAYFVGCSNGGRQGMVASQRFPTYFDGIVAGAPGFDLPRAAVAEAWNEQALAPLATSVSTNGQPYLVDTFSDADLALAANAILAACDDLDGLVDGIVDNYAACKNRQVYPQLEAIQCTGAKTASCLSADQIEALKMIYAGPENSRGKALYTDWQWDPGISGFTSLRLWSLGYPVGAPVNTALNLTLGGGSLPHVFVTPPDVTPLTGLEAYIFGFNFDTDAPKIFQTSGIYAESSMQFMTARSTNLSAFKKQGGKMIIYHGNSDGVFSPHDTIKWYGAMDERMPGKAQRFARLFLVPGMGHCGGGPGTTVFDAFTPLVNWVEHGIAPDSIAATAPSGTPWPAHFVRIQNRHAT